MAQTVTQSLRDAVQRLSDHNLHSKLAIVGVDLKLIAELVRGNFNDGQPVEVFHITVADGGFVLRASLDAALDRYYARRYGDQSPSEISPMAILERASA